MLSVFFVVEHVLFKIVDRNRACMLFRQYDSIFNVA